MKKTAILFAFLTASIYGLKAQPWLTNGTNVYYNGGNVGIGTNTPATKLHVVGVTAIGQNTNGTAIIDAFGGSAYFGCNAANNGISINAYGKVGIGTTSPDGLLTISENNQVLNFLSNKKLSGSWPPIAENNTYTIQSSGTNPGNLAFAVGNSEIMRISSNGNLGIGTNSPLEKFEIKNGNFRFNGITASAQGTLGKIDFFNSYAQSNIVAARIEGKRDNQSYKDGRLSFYTADVNGNLNENMVIDRYGNLGIGTTAPGSKLEIADNHNYGTNWDGIIIRSASSGGTPTIPFDFGGVTWKHGGNEIGRIKIIQDNPYASWFSRMSFWLQSNGVDAVRMTILSDGNVGIGTESPHNKLDVAGTIRCTEVKVVALPWSDFVFHPTYKLRTLGEVEQFIKANRHLPDVPTEAEVKVNGVSLGEMNAKLLQKVEELTLYVIEQQKQINELKEQNLKFSKEMETIKK